MDVSSPVSINKLIVEVYKKEALKSTEKNGFAFVSQKLSLKGLRVLIPAHLNVGTAEGMYVRSGSTVYIKEEVLHTHPWAQKALECSFIESPFIIVDMSYVEFIVP